MVSAAAAPAWPPPSLPQPAAQTRQESVMMAKNCPRQFFINAFIVRPFLRPDYYFGIRLTVKKRRYGFNPQ
jgi:hypothetical protein